MSSLMEKLKQSRGKQGEAVREAAKRSGGYVKDERIWKYSGIDVPQKTDKGKKQQYSESVIRFLPISFVDMERQEKGLLAEHQVLAPVVTVSKHDFKVNGRVYSEYSRQMLGEKCPINEFDRESWNAWKEAGKPDNEVKKTLVARLSKDEYYANILVKVDKANPQNEGKVFLFRFTNAIMGMINEALTPSMPGKDPIDPFDYLDGHDLVLKFMMPEQTYGTWTGFAPKDIPKESYFEKEATPLAETDSEIEEIMKKAYSLTEFTDLKNFKDYEVLESRFFEVMGIEQGDASSVKKVAQNTGNNGNANSNDDASNGQQVSNQAPVQQTVVTEQSSGDLDEFEALLAQAGVS